MTSSNELDAEWVLSQLSLEEKVGLLAGVGRCKTTGIERLNVPSIKVRPTMSSSNTNVMLIVLYRCQMVHLD